MKLLHLFSNHKLTGPAEPAVRLAAHLRRRGHEVLFAHTPLPEPLEGKIDAACRAYDVPTTTAFGLPKHFDALATWRDSRALARLIDEEGFEVVHCNMLGDHLTGALAAARAKVRPKVVRTNYEAVPLPSDLRNRFLLPRRVDALIELSRQALDVDVARFDLRPEQVHLLETSVQLERFDPDRALPDLRAAWGFGPEQFVVGLAARIQRHRRYEVLLEAVAQVRERLPHLRLVLIGRGTHMEEVAVQPVEELGLQDVTAFPGYLREDDYVGALKALDVKVFLVPGTDGSCRAAREAMAVGTPILAARRGMLPEIVTDGRDGLVVDDDPAGLAEALLRLGNDPDLVRRLGTEARATALARFDPARQAEQVEAVYRGLLEPGDSPSQNTHQV